MRSSEFLLKVVPTLLNFIEVRATWTSQYSPGNSKVGRFRQKLFRSPRPRRSMGVIGERLRRIREGILVQMPDDDVYFRLKKEVAAKKLSAFITGAVRARLHPDARTLNAAYKAASRELWRSGLSEDWKHTEDEGWPK